MCSFREVTSIRSLPTCSDIGSIRNLSYWRAPNTNVQSSLQAQRPVDSSRRIKAGPKLVRGLNRVFGPAGFVNESERYNQLPGCRVTYFRVIRGDKSVNPNTPDQRAHSHPTTFMTSVTRSCAIFHHHNVSQLQPNARHWHVSFPSYTRRGITNKPWERYKPKVNKAPDRLQLSTRGIRISIPQRPR